MNILYEVFKFFKIWLYNLAVILKCSTIETLRKECLLPMLTNCIIYFILGTQTVATHDTKSMQTPTIWCTNCAILLTKNGKKKWCTPCMSFRDTLRSQLSRLKHMETHPDRLINPYSHTAYKHLDREELSSRLRKVHQLQLSSAQKVKKLTTSHCGKDGTFH